MAKHIDIRLWGRVRKTSTCWIWGGCTVNGYGHIMYQTKVWKVHRLSYYLLVGPIPNGLQLDHLCRNRACVNPAHLEPVTGKVNTLRGQTITAANATAMHCKRGHEFEPANTHIDKEGKRICRTCARDKSRMHQRKVRTKAKAAVIGDRACEHCGDPLPFSKKAGTRFCSRHCKSLHRSHPQKP